MMVTAAVSKDSRARAVTISPMDHSTLDVTSLGQNVDDCKTAQFQEGDTQNQQPTHPEGKDIIVDMPYEILCHITNYLSTDIIISCANEICHGWRSKLLQFPEPWRRLCAYDKIKQPSQTFEILPLVSQHIKELTLRTQSRRILPAIQLLQGRDKFPQLYLLTILRTALSTVNIMNPLYDALPSLTSLTELRIYWVPSGTMVSLAKILEGCAKLSLLKLTVWGITDFHSSHITSLIALDLQPTAFENGISASKLAPVLKRSPRLAYLSIHCDKTDDDILSALHGHCPALTTIITNRNLYETSYSKRLKLLTLPEPAITPVNDNDNDGGVYDGCFVLYETRSALHSLQARLTKVSRTLKTLYLAPPITHIPVHQEEPEHVIEGAITVAAAADLQRSLILEEWRSLSSSLCSASALSHLHINASQVSETSFSEHIPILIRSCPALETLVLEHFRMAIGSEHLMDDVFQTIQQYLPRLDCLKLLRCNIRGPSFIELLKSNNNTASPSAAFSLRELAIHDCPGTSTQVLRHIAKMKSLETISIHLNFLEHMTTDTTEFINMLPHQLPNLSELIMNPVALFGSISESLIACKNLGHLVLFHEGYRAPAQEQVQLLRRHIKKVEIIIAGPNAM